MCAVSAIGDHYGKKFPIDYPNRPWDIGTPIDSPWDYPNTFPPLPKFPAQVNLGKTNVELEAEIEKLRKEVEDMKEILLVAKKYDEENNEPHCEMDEKVALLKKVAAFVGVDLTEIFDILEK